MERVIRDDPSGEKFFSVDGQHRYLACRELGIECPTREYEGDDPVAFVISLNLKRRRLNESQRAMVAAELANMPVGNPTGSNQHERKEANLPNSTSQAQAADLLNISERTIRAAVKVKNEAAPEVVELVRSG